MQRGKADLRLKASQIWLNLFDNYNCRTCYGLTSQINYDWTSYGKKQKIHSDFFPALIFETCKLTIVNHGNVSLPSHIITNTIPNTPSKIIKHYHPHTFLEKQNRKVLIYS